MSNEEIVYCLSSEDWAEIHPVLGDFFAAWGNFLSPYSDAVLSDAHFSAISSRIEGLNGVSDSAKAFFRDHATTDEIIYVFGD